MRKILQVFVLFFAVLIVSEAFGGGEGYEQAVRYYVKKDYRNAVEYLKEYVSQRPDPSAYYLLGYACYKLKRFDEANRYFAEAYLIDPLVSPKGAQQNAGN